MSNQELQKQESQNSQIQLKKPNNLIGKWIQNETEHAVALTYTEKKIGYFSREDMTKLVEVMAKWRLLLGVTTDSTEHELVVICQFIYDNFKNYTLSDIEMAMNWSIAGRLDLGFVSQKTISSYYVSKAINAYNDEKRIIFNKIIESKEKHERWLEQQQKKVLTPLEKANNFKDIVVMMYSVLDSEGVFYDIGDMVYNWLKKTNQLDTTKETIDKAVQYGRNRFFEEVAEQSIRKRLSQTSNDETREQKQKKYAREYMVKSYFNSHDISEVLSKIQLSHFSETLIK